MYIKLLSVFLQVWFFTSSTDVTPVKIFSNEVDKSSANGLITPQPKLFKTTGNIFSAGESVLSYPLLFIFCKLSIWFFTTSYCSPWSDKKSFTSA